jgi:Bifunctional DNA primase/polymerase, N-terminal
MRARYVAEIAEDYRDRGWDPFPLPWHRKFPPPADVTGYDARLITGGDYRRWAEIWANIGLVMPETVVGIDFDGYKDGHRAPSGLPPTVRSTSRTDGSGIFLFTVPEGTRLETKVKGVGEVVQWFHRYAVCWPSVHPEGGVYRWLDDGDNEVEIPYVDNLPPLPERWLQRLAARPRVLEGTGYAGGVDVWLAELPGGRMSRLVRAELARRTRELRRYQVTGSTRYDTMVQATGKLVHLGAQRQRGVAEAIDRYSTEYLSVMDGERNRDPESELHRALAGAVAKWGSR